VNYPYFDRDLSWLSFNGRVLDEAANPQVPLVERIRFLSIYSSNLDEFYRVRIPALMALQKIKKNKEKVSTPERLQAVTEKIHGQLRQFGSIIQQNILPELAAQHIQLIYDGQIPEPIRPQVADYFFTHVMAFLQPVNLDKKSDFFPVNNELYLTVCLRQNDQDKTYLLNIPSASLGRFFMTTDGATTYVLFVDDIIRHMLPTIFPGSAIGGAWSIKVTRDAELDLQDEFEGDLAEKIEKQIARRDLGFATRLLYSPGIPDTVTSTLIQALGLRHASVMEGGRYHHLRDLAQFPVQHATLCYPRWPGKRMPIADSPSLLDSILQQDLLLHPPYHDYNLVLRFFNEAALDTGVQEIWITLYRIAGDSRIATALITAARNGKQVTVFVELKARFDEANNIRWAKKMKEAGVRIVYSIPTLKVHAKIAMIKKQAGNRVHYAGLLATGNFNESTARFYTDHILFTANGELLQELELLFLFLAKRKHPDTDNPIHFQHLLVAQFNLLQQFTALIDREISYARAGLPARIHIKLNNLEESVLINKLYEASQAGVTILLLVRGICRLIPGEPGISERIEVRRIVDRYLEHGRIYYFHNNGSPEVFAGSADWMERNIYRRIEVCFPIVQAALRQQLIELFDLQWSDNQQATSLDNALHNQPVPVQGEPLRSQEAIWKKINSDD